MAHTITVTIPHQLTREEAKRRIQDELALAGPRLGLLSAAVEQSWSGDTLDFTARAAGQSVNGRAFVEDRQVRVEVTLPWLLAALAGTVRRGIEERGRLLLGPRSGAPEAGGGGGRG